MRSEREDDGMRHSGQIPTRAEREEERLRKELDRLAARCEGLEESLGEAEREIDAIADFIADGDQCPHAVTRLNDLLTDIRALLTALTQEQP